MGAIDRSFYADALCRTDDGVPKVAWTVDNRQAFHRIDGRLYKTSTLIDLALRTCQICPVQWECAAAAIESNELLGTWGDRIEHLVSYGNVVGQDKYREELMAAKRVGRSVQVVVATRLQRPR